MDSSSTALWYISRATGMVSLVLFTAVMVLGLLVSRQGKLPGLPRFARRALHRYLSLLAVSFVAVHVASAVADSFVNIGAGRGDGPVRLAVPPVWLGLGAVALDLMIAVIVTSLSARRIGRRTWRAVHWLAYASWPVAIAHSIGAGRPAQRSAAWLAIACTPAVAIAVALRTPPRCAPPPGAADHQLLLAMLPSSEAAHR